MMAQDGLTVSNEAGVMIITLDRPEDALAVDAAWNIALGGGPDVKEGVAAFLEKRAPSFPGKASADLPAGVPWWG
jgi:enoyl-CoA hydratase/carnithine racemase